MINCKLFFSTLSLILFFFGAKSANAYTPQRGNVYTALGPYFYKTNYEGSATSKFPRPNGITWQILGDVSDQGSLEINNTLMDKIYVRKNQGKIIAEQAQVVQVSVGYRYWLDHRFSASMSLHTIYPLGNSQKIFNEFGPNETLSTTADENSEMGLDFGLQADVWSAGRYALVVEGKYSLALSRKSDEYADQYGAFIGIRYFFQGKDAPKN